MARKLKKLNVKEKLDAVINRLLGRAKTKKDAEEKDRYESAAMNLQKVREENNKIGFWKGLKYKIASLFGIKKHSKTGRFGTKKTTIKNDSIERMGDEYQDQYFDPFQQISDEISENNEGRSLQEDFSERVEDQLKLSEENDFDKGTISDSEEQRLVLVAQKKEAEKISVDLHELLERDLTLMSDPYGAFVASIDVDKENEIKQKKKVEKNGEEENREENQDENNLAGAGMQNAPGDENIEDAENHAEENNVAGEVVPNVKNAEQSTENTEKAVGSDNFVETAPKQFQITVAVSGRPADYYTKMSRLKTLERIAAMGKKKPKKVQTPEEEKAEKDAAYKALATKAVKESPEYREITAKGVRDAKAAGVKYDPLNDPNVEQLIIRTSSIELRSTGHSSIGMDTLRNEKLVKRYTFGFFPGTDTKQEETVIGEVCNPDRSFDRASTKRSYRVSYKDYLKAAAKIRGIKGSRRAYKVTGYNCTSFAIDIAKEAGINFADNEVAEDYVSSSSNYHLVDSPAALAAKLEKDNAAASGLNIAEYSTVLREAEIRNDETAGEQILQKMKQDGISPMLVELVSRNSAFQEEAKNEEANGGITPESRVNLIISATLRLFKAISAKYNLPMDKNGHLVQNDNLKVSDTYEILKQRKEALLKAFGTDSVYSFVVDACKDASQYSFALNMIKGGNYVYNDSNGYFDQMMHSSGHDEFMEKAEAAVRIGREEEERREREVNEKRRAKAERIAKERAGFVQYYTNLEVPEEPEGFAELYSGFVGEYFGARRNAFLGMYKGKYRDIEDDLREKYDPEKKVLNFSSFEEYNMFFMALLIIGKKDDLINSIKEDYEKLSAIPMNAGEVSTQLDRACRTVDSFVIAKAYKFMRHNLGKYQTDNEGNKKAEYEDEDEDEA